MMGLTKLVLKRPVSVVIMILVIILYGISSIMDMEQELTPEMNMPMLVVMTPYSGASPEDVDELVTTVIEDNLSTLDGVESVTSTSSEGSSTVMLEYSYGTDMDQASQDVSKKLNTISSRLPEACETPNVLELDMNSSSSMTLSVSGSPAGGLYNYIKNTLQPELEKLSAVADVSTAGGQQEYISISLNRDAMEQYGLSISTVASAISSADFTASIGETSLGKTDINVSAGQDFDTAESLKSVVISTGSGGVIQLSDIAEISRATEESGSVSRYNGEDTISLSISKNQSSTASALSEQVKQAIENLQQSSQDVSIVIVNDDADSISSSIQSIFQTLLLAILISMIILFLFLGDLRASLIVASSMPVSVLVALILMNALDYTLNMITMCALVIGVGMMVDNSIVVLESCFRSREKGLTLMEAAVQGTKEVMASVTAGTITTVVVFLPLAFIGGMVGQLFKPLGFVIIFSLCASLLSAVTLVPFAYYRYRPQEKEKAPLSRLMRWLTEAYRQALSYLLHRKKLVFGTVALLLMISVISVTQVNSELMSSTDNGTISISVTTQQGLKLEETEKINSQIEDIIAENTDVSDYMLTSGGSGMMSSSGSSFTVYLKDDREKSTDEIISAWKTEMGDIRNCDIEVSNSSSMSSMAMSQDTVTVALKGSEYANVQQACSEIVSDMRSRADVARVSSTFSEGGTLAKLQFDPQLCASYGFRASDVAATVNQIVNGVTATQLTENGQEYDVIVEYTDRDYDSVEDISHIQVTSSSGYTVDLSDIAEIVYKDSSASISKDGGSYNATVEIELKQDSLSSYDEVNRAVRQISLPSGVEFSDSSMQQSMNDEFSRLYKAILIAVFLVFAVMAMQFESVRFSLMVMICIPFCFIGSFLMLYFTGTSISMVSLLGFVMLIGTVVNSGILYVDTANSYRKTMDRDTALIEAGVTRLRPILMTTLTTICSMIPMALAMGENAEMLQGFAVVAVGGLTASTLMALLMLPTFYLVMDKKEKDRSDRKEKRREKRRFQKKRRQASEEGGDSESHTV